MDSIWTKNTRLPHFQSLQGNQKTDVLIIGGGMAGILCALFLQQKGVDYTLVERQTICSGVTKDTTAKITALHRLEYHKLLKHAGVEKTRQYLDANLTAVRKFAELCRKIDCDFETETDYVYSMNHRQKLEQELDALRRLGHDAIFSQTPNLPFPTQGAIGFEHQAQFHPLKFISGIAQGLHIFEHTFIKEFKDHIAVTENGNISFQKMIFATHFPIDNKHGMYFLKMYQNRSYVIALSGAKKVDGMYVDESETGLSFRNYGDYLLLGGGAHRTGKQGGNWQALRSFAASHYPDATEQYAWAAQDCMTLDGLPYIGAYAKHMPDCFVATGFNKWGMTGSMAAAIILSDLVLEKESPYAQVFCPSRSMLHLQLLCNGWEALTGLLTFSAKRCPHMGCALKWNPVEHSWDCSCHGSRFDSNGNLLDNPANGTIKIK